MLKRPLLAVVFVVLAILASPGIAAAQDLDWGPCPPGSGNDPRQECALLTVPLDYSNPGGETIAVAVSRIKTSVPAKHRGVLLFNPGGPGGSGLPRMPLSMKNELPAVRPGAVRPDRVRPARRRRRAAPSAASLRGRKPTPLEPPYKPPRPLSPRGRRPVPRTAAPRNAPPRAQGHYSYITTLNTARDMDVIRTVLGENKLSYLGYSYGTYLGAVYMQLFPRRADRIVLDSNVHPQRIWRPTTQSWGYGVEVAYAGFTHWAAERDDLPGHSAIRLIQSHPLHTGPH